MPKYASYPSGAPAALSDKFQTVRGSADQSMTVGAVQARNLLINANFVINQRGYASGAVLAAGVYGHDRWKAGAGGGDYTFAQLPNDTIITIAAAHTLVQVVEDKHVEGGNYVLSWAGAAQARVGINTATPAGAYAASPIAITGQTAGTTMSVEFNAGTLGTAMLAPGTEAAPFQRRPFAVELDLCQRYYEKSYALTTPVPTNAAFYSESAQALSPIPNQALYGVAQFKVRKRAAPTVTTYSYTSSTANTASDSSGGADLTSGSATISSANERSFVVFNNSGVSLGPVGKSVAYHWAASAEL